MGNNCSPSNLDSYTTFFDVYNVDAKLFKHSKGRIQITSNSLLLHSENVQTSVRKWPLIGIRRYGYHKNIFLFECGRKCSSGEGLYAFKCNKAKRLNETIQKAVVNNATQLCNLQKSANQQGLNNISAIKASNTNASAAESRTINDSDSLNYASLNEQMEHVDSIEVNNNNNNSNKLHYQDLGGQNRLSQSDIQNNQPGPYYVNDNLVRLPLDLSSSNKNTEYNNYVNTEQVDPCILRITDQFNTQRNKEKKKKSNKSSLIDTPYLNYVIPERVVSGHQENSEINYINPANLSNTGEKVKKQPEPKVESNQTDYVVIDKDKTPAMHFSIKQIENKRMEYLMLSKPT